MQEWMVNILPKADEDIAALLEGDPGLKDRLFKGINEEFHGMKGDRVDKLLVQGVTTPRLDRLDGALFPGSIRLQILGDYRATALCLPAYRQAFIVHVFHKSRDPKYRKALPIHNKRVSEFVEDFSRFMSRRK